MPVEGPIYYRLNDDNTGPELLLEVFRERGWLPWDESLCSSEDIPDDTNTWHIWWRHGFPSTVYRKLHSYQFVSHIPKGNGLCRKDSLARALQNMKRTFGNAYDFFPTTFLLPCEYTKLVAEYTKLLYPPLQPSPSNSTGASNRRRTAKRKFGSPCKQLRRSNSFSGDSRQPSKETNVWICKPTMSSQGRGISIFEDVHQLSYGDSAVAQKYISNPLLVGGYKCDLRLYVLVTSLVPLTVYMYKEGIVRFGTEKYNLSTLDRLCSHLTNTSLNKTSPGYKVEKDRIGSGCKWSLRQLRRHFSSNGYCDWLLWQRVNVLVTLTLLAQLSRLQTESNLPHGAENCFELYGFDILVDENLTPWLLEVNRCPSLSYDCEVDRLVKKPMLHHLFDLLSVPRVSQPIERALNVPPLVKRNKSCGRLFSATSQDIAMTVEQKKEKHSPKRAESFASVGDIESETEINQLNHEKSLRKIFSNVNISEIHCEKCSLPCDHEATGKPETNTTKHVNNYCILSNNISLVSRKDSLAQSKVDLYSNEALSCPNSNREKENDVSDATKRRFLCKDCKKKLREGLKRRNSTDMISHSLRGRSYRRHIGLKNARKILRNHQKSNSGLIKSSFFGVPNSYSTHESFAGGRFDEIKLNDESARPSEMPGDFSKPRTLRGGMYGKTSYKVAEEVAPDTFVPVAFNSTFQRLRQQLLSVNLGATRNRSSRWHPAFDPSRRSDGRGGPSSCGGWIRTFPFNTASMHATRHPMQIRNAVTEVHKFRRGCEKVASRMKDTCPTSFKMEGVRHEQTKSASDGNSFSSENDTAKMAEELQSLVWRDQMMWTPGF